MQLQEARTPSGIGDFSVRLVYIADPGEDETQKQVWFDIQVLDQTGRAEWLQQGDLVPFLVDESTYLTLADRAVLLDLMTRVRQEAVLRILGA